MPIITSYALLAESSKKYFAGINYNQHKRNDEDTNTKILQTKTEHNLHTYLKRNHQVEFECVYDVSDFVITLCNKILNSEPELMQQIASGDAEKETIAGLISQIVERENMHESINQDILFHQVFDFLFGYGPLQSWIEDETISDIDGNAPDEFTITRLGKREQTTLRFPDERSYDAFCRLMVVRNGGIINENDTHCRVSDIKHHLRINVTVPPRSVRYASISIRKHRKKAYSFDDLQSLNMIDQAMKDKLHSFAQNDTTVLFCGKGGSGKTTLLRSFINQMPLMERILVAESDSEIFPEKPGCLLQKIKKKHEGGRPVDLRDLIADGLTMSLDSYCIGEIVGDEAMEFLRAAYSGHRCLATIHSESAEEALDRLLSLARPACHGESEHLMKHMIGTCVDVVIYLKDFKVQKIIQLNQYNQECHSYEFSHIQSSSEIAPTNLASSDTAGAMVSGT